MKRYNAYLKANNAEHSALTLRGFRDNGGRPTAHGKATKTNEEVELTFEDYLTAAIEKYGIEEAVDIADAAFLNKDISIFSDN